MSHPEETHDPAVGVRWGVTAAGPLLFSPLSIFSRPAHCWKGQMRGQGGHRGRGGRRGRWRRWRRGRAGGGGGGAVPLRGQGCRWLQRVVQKSQEWGLWWVTDLASQVAVRPTLDWVRRNAITSLLPRRRNGSAEMLQRTQRRSRDN